MFFSAVAELHIPVNTIYTYMVYESATLILVHITSYRPECIFVK